MFPKLYITNISVHEYMCTNHLYGYGSNYIVLVCHCSLVQELIRKRTVLPILFGIA